MLRTETKQSAEDVDSPSSWSWSSIASAAHPSLYERLQALNTELDQLSLDDPELATKSAVISSHKMEVYMQMLEAENKNEASVDVIEEEMFGTYYDLYKPLYNEIKNDPATNKIRIRLREDKEYNEDNENKPEDSNKNHLEIDLHYIFKLAVKIFKPAKRISLQDINEITYGLCTYNMYSHLRSAGNSNEGLHLMRQWRLLLESMLACGKHILQNMKDLHLFGFRLYWLKKTAFNDLVQFKPLTDVVLEEIPPAEDQFAGRVLRMSFQAQDIRLDEKKSSAYIRQLENNLHKINQKIHLMTNPLFSHHLHRTVTPKPPVPAIVVSFEEAKETVAIKSSDNKHKKARVRRTLL